MPISRRHLLLASATLPSLASCASDISRYRERPVTALAKDLSICTSAYAVLRGAQPGTSVVVSGCAEPGELAEPIFQAASLTKPVIALGALQLALDGRLDLKAPASHYLPAGYKHYHSVLARLPDDPHDVVSPAVLARVSIAELLNHTSGLPNWSSGPLSFEFEPGQRWGYSGEGFVLLQSVIEAVTGMELSAYFDKHVFAKLGMPDTSLVWRDSFAARVVSGTSVLGRKRQIRFLKPVAAASLYTTAADYAKFMSAALSNEQIVSLVLSSSARVDSALGLQWGLGWGIEYSDGGPCIWQWGNNPGYRAFAMASVASKDGFVILTNNERGMPLAASLAHSVLPAEHNAFKFSWVA
jgi:CubicO group peptidase (beta-lactamase class C family)